MKKSFLTLSVSILSVFLLAACAGEQPQAPEAGSVKPKTVKIGVIAPLSGDAGAYGAEAQKVLDYQLAEVNRLAAKKGVSFQLVYEDGKCSGTDSVSSFQKLTDVDGVKIIIGGFCSSETLAAAPLAQSKEVVLLSVGSSNPAIENEGDYVFTLSYKDSLVGEGLAAELSKFTKVAMITEQNDYNIGIQKVVLDELKEMQGVELVANEIFPKGGSDFRNLLEKIAKADPEAVLLNPNPGVTSQNLLRQISEIPAWKNFSLIGQFGYLADDARAQAQEAAEGMLIVDAPLLTDPVFVQKKDEITADRGTLETLGLYYTATVLDSLNILSGLVTELGNDPAQVKEALRSRTFEGYTGKIYFGDQNFVQNIPVGRYLVQDGKAVYQQ